MRRNRFQLWLAVLGLAAFPSVLYATPYASNVSKTGTTVNFTLNETADSLTYTINGGAPQTLDGATIGAKTFNLNLASDTFSIIAEKNAATGFSIPTGASTPEPVPPNNYSEIRGVRIARPLGGYSLVSDENNALTRFNSPRGVGVSNNPNAPNFGTAYVANSVGGALATAPARTLTGEGIYALRADGSDAFGQGDEGRNPDLGGLPTFNTSSTNSPFRVHVSRSGEVYVADFSDANSNVFILNPSLTTSVNALAGFDGGGTLPSGGNHGSALDMYATGSLATNDLVLYTMDEDLEQSYFDGGAVPGSAKIPPGQPTVDKQSIWKYEIGGTADSTVTPTKIPSSIIGFAYIATANFDIGADGKIYTAQNRQEGNEAGLFVLDSEGAVLWDSLSASRELLENPAAQDILTSLTGGVTVSPDQKWLATLFNRSDLAVMPMVDGLPDISKLLVIDTTTTDTENQGRDIAFDAANNIHYVSSGQARYRVLAPGGHTKSTLSFNGSEYAFNVQTITGTPGDFNGDSIVDGTDFLTWQQNNGLTGTATTAQGDANGDQDVDADDLAIWQTNFGAGLPTAAVAAAGSVPEPANWCSAIVAAVAVLALRLPGRRMAVQLASR